MVRSLLKSPAMRSPLVLAGTAIWLLTSVGCGASLPSGTGAGGSTGTGATGGGTGGNIGAAIDGGESCDQLNTAYAAALTAALACTPGAPNQCQAPVATMPTRCPGSDCGSQELVNDGTAVEAVRERWLAACNIANETCIEIGCDPPAPPTACVATGPNAATGTCTLLGSDAGSGVVPDGGESCNQLVADYRAAVSAALACTPGAPNQCQSHVTKVPAEGPDPADCEPMTTVNDPSGVTAALQRWSAQCKISDAILLIKCDPQTQPAICVPNVDAGVVSGSAGTCVPMILD
jgi:hypothetical protein